MLHNLFNNIGKNLKNFAIGTFIVESLAGIIGGIALIVDSGDPHPLGLALIFLSPFVAYGSAMFLYAFGELVDKVCEIAVNTRTSKNVPTSFNTVNNTVKKTGDEKPIYISIPASQTSTRQQCPHCGDTITSKICPMCGKENNLFK